MVLVAILSAPVLFVGIEYSKYRKVELGIDEVRQASALSSYENEDSRYAREKSFWGISINNWAMRYLVKMGINRKGFGVVVWGKWVYSQQADIYDGVITTRVEWFPIPRY